MADLNYKKTVGTALCLLFGTFVLTDIFNLFSNLLGLYNPKVMPFFWMTMNLFTAAAAAIIAFYRHSKITIIAKIGAFALNLLYILFFINQIVILTSDGASNIFAFLGNNASPIIETVIYCAIALMLFGLKIWNPIKYIGILGYIPSIISSLTIIKLNDVYNAGNFEQYEGMFSRIELLGNISLGINIITLVLIIVWLATRPRIPSIQSNAIDII